MNTTRGLLAVIVALALVLRVLYALGQPPAVDFADRSGDSGWYLANALALVGGTPPPEVPVNVSRLGIPPVYLLFTGLIQLIVPQSHAALAIRLAQALLGAATCLPVFGLGRLLGGTRAGLIAAAGLAVSPAFVIEPSLLLTETVYLLLLAGGLWAFVRFAAESERRDRRLLALAGGLLGLATLTRAVLLLFPLGLALHLLLIDRRAGLRWAALLLAVYAAVVSTWTVYNLARWNRLVIAGEGLAANLFISATGWQGGQDLDSELAETVAGASTHDTPAERQEAFLAGAGSVIAANPLGYLGRRLGELGGAFVQPHNTVVFPGESLRALAVNWWRGDRSPAGLLALTRADAFWPKLALYGFHFGALGLGVIGLWIGRRRWQTALPLAGLIAYTALVHLFALALPRYLFPSMLAWYVFAAVALASIRSGQAAPEAVPTPAGSR